MPELIAPRTARALTQAVVGARPTLAADGVDCATWLTGGAGPGRVTIVFDGTVAAVVADPSGGTTGVEVWGYEGGQWSIVASLNGGVDVPIVGGTSGWITTLDLGRPYDRLYVAGAPSAGVVSARFVPLEVEAD